MKKDFSTPIDELEERDLRARIVHEFHPTASYLDYRRAANPRVEAGR